MQNNGGSSSWFWNRFNRKIARSRTEATLNKLRVGLESFKSKYGYYPQQQNIGAFQLYISTSIAAPGDEKYNFSLFIESSKIKNEDAVPLNPQTTPPSYYITDGWKTAIRVNGSGSDFLTVSGQGVPCILYICPGIVNTSTYDLFSAGYDRKFKWGSTAEVADPSNADNIWPQGLKTQ